jgi:hypothetical protein
VSANARTSRAVAEVQAASASAAAEFEALHAAMFTQEMRADGEAKLAWVRVRKAWRTVQPDLELVRRAIGWTSADPLTLFLAVVQQPRETLVTELFPDATQRATRATEDKAFASKKRVEKERKRDSARRRRLEIDPEIVGEVLRRKSQRGSSRNAIHASLHRTGIKISKETVSDIISGRIDKSGRRKD